MVTLTKDKITWRFDSIPDATKKALDYLSSQPWLENGDWYLAGGTALSLRAGHRVSVDLDFFTKQSSFDTTDVLNELPRTAEWKTTMERKNTIYGELFGAKISFIAYPFFLPLHEPILYGSIKVLQPDDIAVMKIIAIAQRGKKRDFFDLYWCAKNVEPLGKIIIRLKKQYPSVAHDYHHILKSLTYFEDAESDPTPSLNFKASWSEVKAFFKREIPRITKRVLKLE